MIAPTIVIDRRNELFRENTTTLKKSFPKSIKNSLHNRFLKVGHFTSVKKVVFFQNLDILYRKSYSKFDGF